MKPKNRSEQRQTIMIILYQIFLFEQKENLIELQSYIEEMTKKEEPFVKDTINGVLKNRVTIIEKANQYLKDWSLDRLSKIDQAIISIGIYELLWTDTPPVVCINEAIELAKQYSDDAVRKMINGILDKVYRNKE
ncbi:MAG: transcription antitermination factor NusB [Bacilli bacterium]|jgi:N utilization substance protein B|nr:transcription antitermination factor NusB [Bacilli bacterium]